jgi:glycosyltransferase involved in cell wall biosynthesis
MPPLDSGCPERKRFGIFIRAQIKCTLGQVGQLPVHCMDATLILMVKDIQMTQKSIVIVGHASGSFLGGAELSFVDLVKSATSLGKRVVAVIPNQANPEYIQRIKLFTQEIYYVEIKWFEKNYTVDTEIVEKLSRIALDVNAEMILSNTVVMQEPLIAARKICIPAICIAREVPESGTVLAGILDKGLEELITEIHSLADYIIANSKYTLSVYFLDGATSIVRNTYSEDLLTIGRESHSNFNIGFVGNSHLEKGIGDLIRIAQHFEAHDRIRFQVFGVVKDSLPPATVMNLPRNIEFMGYESKQEKIFANQDLMLQLSTLNETFSRVTLETMAAGLPIIAYNVGALAELVVNGITGYLVKPGDTNEVQRLIHQVMQNQNIRKTMGEAAREYAKEHFCPALQAKDLQMAFESISANYAKNQSFSTDIEIEVPRENRSHHKEPFLVGNRARFATATGVKFITNNILVVASLVGKRMYLYEFDPKSRSSKFLSSVDTENGVTLVSIDNIDFNGGGLVIAADCEFSSISKYRVLDSSLGYLETLQVGKKPSNYVHGAKFVSSSPEILAACITAGEKGISFYLGAGGRKLGHYSTKDWGVKDMAMLNLESHKFIAVCTKNNVGQDLDIEQSISLRLVQTNKRFFKFKRFKEISELILQNISIESIQIRDNYIFLATQSSDSVLVMRHDERNIYEFASVEGFSFPHGVDISPDGKWMAVANYGSNSVSVRENIFPVSENSLVPHQFDRNAT